MTADRKARQRLYKTVAWYKLRSHQLKRSPLCVMCSDMNVIRSADIVDHIIPHRGDAKLFHDADNLQSLCKRCHDTHKQRIERTGVAIGGDVKGFPVDPKHHWGGEG